MKKSLTLLLCAALLGASPAFAAGTDFDLNVHIGSRGVEPIIVSEPPLFLESASLGLQVAVGCPYDMFHIDGRFFLFKDRGWLVAPGCGGPWTAIRHDRLPPGLAKRNYGEILALRNAEYESYQQGRYRGKTFRPGKTGHGNGKGKRK